MDVNFYKRLIEESHIGYAYLKIIRNNDGNPFDYEFVEVNAVYKELSGLAGTDIVGKSATEVILDINDSEIGGAERFGDIRAYGGTKEYEQFSEKLNRWVRVKLFSSEKNYFTAQLIDITHEKCQFAELENTKTECEYQNELVKMLLDTMPSAVFSVDNRCKITNWNRRAEVITGYTSDEVLGRGCSKFTLEPCRSICGLFSVDIEKPISGKVCTIKTKQGETLTILKSANLIKDIDGSIIGGIECFEDITNQIRMEQRLRESEEKYRLIFEHTPLGVLHFDKTGRITECNDNFVRTIGSSMDALIGFDMFEIPDEKVTEALRQALQGQLGYFEGEYQSVTADKRTPVRVMFAPIRLKGDAVEGGVGIVEDITERKLTEDALLESTEFWKAIITASPDGIGLIGLDGKLQFASEKLAEMYGYSPDERAGLVGRWVIDFIEPSCHKRLTENICKLLAGIQRDSFTEYQAIKKDNSRFFIEVTSTVLKDARGKATNILIIERDITERKEAEMRLRISEEKYIAIFDQSPIAIEVYDGDGCLVYVNNACLDLFGMSSIHEIKGFKLFEDPNISEHAKKELLANQYVRFEMVFSFDLAKENKLYETTCSGVKNMDVTIKSLLHDKENNGYIVQILDITEQKKAQAEIEYLGYHDSLTGLYNRRFYENELDRLDTERNLPLTLIMADVNGLKLINDSFGHSLGDELLRKTAKAITNGCRYGEIAARLGGDEFVVLLPNTDSVQAERIIQRIKENASQDKVGLIDISISFGYGTKVSKEERIQEIFRRAEDHMYGNKLHESAGVKNKTIDLIMGALFQKNEQNMLHLKRVSKVCESIANAMELEKSAVNQIRVAGLMHNIGHIGIDENILNKAQKLNSDEWNEIKRHPEIGYRILSSSNDFSEIAVCILEHHERWDGTGYPKGLRGEEISLQARIIAVADAYVAMTSEKTYRKQITAEEAINEILRCSETQFDPVIISVFAKICSENELEWAC